MKKQFKIKKLISCITWQRALLSLMFIILVICNGYGQDDYFESDYGTLLTRRNDPYPHTKLDSTIIPCRKLNEVKEVFTLSSQVRDISQILLKPYENLSEEEMAKIVSNAWIKRDTSLLPFLLKIAESDTFIDYIYTRKLSVKSLSRFNNDTVKKVLTNLLKDKEVGMISALSLVQLGQTEQAFHYIQSNYSENIAYNIIPDIATSLMIINTSDAIKLLMKISEHKDPSLALDALAALSILGYCDFAYRGFCKYKTNNVWQVRTKVTNCLLFYIGTPEAINTAKNLYYNEKDSFVRNELENIFKRFNLKI